MLMVFVDVSVSDPTNPQCILMEKEGHLTVATPTLTPRLLETRVDQYLSVRCSLKRKITLKNH